MAFRILSLDGGGIRGAFGASFLATIQEMIDRPIAEYFDLIAGTSTGGIIAVGLGMGETPSAIRNFYESRGPYIFQRQAHPRINGLMKGVAVASLRPVVDRLFRFFGIDLDSDYILQCKYDSRHLERSLKDVFKTRTLENAKTRLVIPAVDLTCGRTIVFKTPHLPGLSRDRVYSAADVVLATTAAPTYFPHSVINTGSAYCDGGLWANNPSMVGYAEAIKIREECKRTEDPRFETNEIFILSVGTGRPTYSLKPPDARAGLGWWGPRLIDTMFVSQGQGIAFQAHYVLGERHKRVDYDIPDTSWSLDNTKLISELFHYGEKKAHEVIRELKPIFFTAPAPSYKKFDPA
jgi:patatin-like phospholipase/acyl hydrolase